jgi:hypothetical protein
VVHAFLPVDLAVMRIKKRRHFLNDVNQTKFLSYDHFFEWATSTFSEVYSIRLLASPGLPERGTADSVSCFNLNHSKGANFNV